MYPKKEKSNKVARTYRLDPVLVAYLEAEASKHDVPLTTVLETALRKQMEASV
ncbi:hypothetical protein [Vibrio owensii]|uniref:hypothetical protein n=1 Tax=Vibrio owensii TaxID=696485 RepID=UPI000AAE2C8C|nr:hypothetical protein [Vibrio owensii]